MTETKTYSSGMAKATGYFSWIHDEIYTQLGDNILEVGFGHGLFTRLLPKRVEYLGVDCDAEDVYLARKKFPAFDFMLADLTQADFPRAVGGAKFDTVLCFNVLEHIENDTAAFSNLAATLIPGGRLIVLVPAMPALFSEMDRAAGHYRRYTIQTVKDLAESTNLREVDVKYLNPIGAVGWWANKLAKPRNLDSTAINRQIAIFDKWILPLSRALGPLTRNLAGLSVLSVHVHD